MIETPEITHTVAQLTAVIPIVVPRTQIRTVMGPGISEVLAALATQGIAPAGPIFSHHFKMTPDVFDFEVGVPVSREVAPIGRVKAGYLPATTVARTVYHGPYEGLGQAWGEFGAWLASSGHQTAPDLWECYSVGPESNPDPANWRTELNRPIVA